MNASALGLADWFAFAVQGVQDVQLKLPIGRDGGCTTVSAV
jgi:hypothetical protein